MAVIVGIVWAVTALTSIITQQYTPLTAETPVMLVVAGFLFGIRGNGNGDDDKNGKSKKSRRPVKKDLSDW